MIPYIASGFRKDKIWLRRTKPSKRQYQVMVAIDDSESMRHTGAGRLACAAAPSPPEPSSSSSRMGCSPPSVGMPISGFRVDEVRRRSSDGCLRLPPAASELESAAPA